MSLLWWVSLNALLAWGDVTFLCRCALCTRQVPRFPYLLSTGIAAALATASLLSPAAGLFLQLALLTAYGMLMLRVQARVLILPVILLLTLNTFRLALYTVVLSTLSLTLNAPGLGLAIQVALSWALAVAQLLTLRAIAGSLNRSRAPPALLSIPSVLLLAALWGLLGLGDAGAFQRHVPLLGGPGAVCLGGLLLLAGALALWSTAAAAYLRVDRLALQVECSSAALMRSEELRAFRHDVRNHMLVLSGLLRAGRAGAAECYLRSLYDLAPALSPGPATGSPVLDALLTEKCRLATEFGVALEVDALFPQSCALGDADLCILLSNALDNALYAAREAAGARPAVVLTLRPDRGFLLVDVVNDTALDAPFVPGTGFANLRRTAEKQGGALHVLRGRDTFRLSILLPLSP